MKLPRRQFLHLAAGAAALPVASRVAWAQSYPTRSVRWIVPFPPGGGTDIVARLIGQWLSGRLGQPFVIENRPGAGTNIGTEAVVRATPDGYTLLLVASVNAINATLYDKLSFNFIRDIAPVASIIRQPLIMLVNPSVPAKTVPEFITYAKANPGKINMASAGNGTSQHVAGELFKIMAGIDMVHVPYRGTAPALTDLLGGQVQVYFATQGPSIEYVRAGKLRALAVTGSSQGACRNNPISRPIPKATLRAITTLSRTQRRRERCLSTLGRAKTPRRLSHSLIAARSTAEMWTNTSLPPPPCG